MVIIRFEIKGSKTDTFSSILCFEIIVTIFSSFSVKYFNAASVFVNILQFLFQ